MMLGTRVHSSDVNDQMGPPAIPIQHNQIRALMGGVNPPRVVRDVPIWYPDARGWDHLTEHVQQSVADPIMGDDRPTAVMAGKVVGPRKVGKSSPT